MSIVVSVGNKGILFDLTYEAELEKAFWRILTFGRPVAVDRDWDGKIQLSAIEADLTVNFADLEDVEESPRAKIKELQAHKNKLETSLLEITKELEALGQ
jgi:hypothetical protein